MSKCNKENLKKGNKYAINGHGTMITNDKDEPYIFTIPANVNIYTFVKLEDRLLCTKDIQYNTCNINQPDNKKSIPMIHKSPGYRYSNSVFPNILFYSDDVSQRKTFYSGIVHCATNCVIHNIDLHIKNDCDCKSIRSIVKPPSSNSSNYNCEKNNYMIDLPDKSSHQSSCGTIFLKDAIDKILKFNKDSSKEIDIYLLTCIEKKNIVEFNNDIQTQFLHYQSLAMVFGSINDKLIPITLPNQRQYYAHTTYNPDIYPNRYEFQYNNKNIIMVFNDGEKQEYILINFLRFIKAQIIMNKLQINDLLDQYSDIEGYGLLEINLQSYNLAEQFGFNEILKVIVAKLQEYINGSSLSLHTSSSPMKNSKNSKKPKTPTLKRTHSLIGTKSPVMVVSPRKTLFKSNSNKMGGNSKTSKTSKNKRRQMKRM